MSAQLIGVIHLPPLLGSPNHRPAHGRSAVVDFARTDAKRLVEAGFDAIVVENYGDAPFFADDVPKITVAEMTAAVLAVRDAAPRTPVCVNVLRNDAAAALAIAATSGANAIRVNVHTGARVTDQGVVTGRAAETLRLRRALGADSVSIWADVAVKHSAALGPRPLEDEAHDLSTRGMVDAVLVTGAGTGKATPIDDVARVKSVVSQPVYVASGATIASLPRLLEVADGVIVGTAIKEGERAGAAVDPERAAAFARAFRAAVPKR